MGSARTGWLQSLRARLRGTRRDDPPRDMDEAFVALYREAGLPGKFSDKLFTTYKAVEYVVRNDIAGDFVECGVFQGRHVALMALTLLRMGRTDRRLFLYDTFAGMTAPGEQDASRSGRNTVTLNRVRWKELQRGDHNLWCYASLEEVQRHVFRTGYPQDRLQFVVGDIRKTVPNDFHAEIALLRLDTDWYELTAHELEHLYDRVAPGGVVVIDDYGCWEGSRKAVDEFFARRGILPLLCRTDRHERMFLKPAGARG